MNAESNHARSTVQSRNSRPVLRHDTVGRSYSDSPSSRERLGGVSGVSATPLIVSPSGCIRENLRRNHAFLAEQHRRTTTKYGILQR